LASRVPLFGASLVVLGGALVFSHAPAAAQPPFAIGATANPTRAVTPLTQQMTVVADRDDDDTDGKPDAEQDVLPPAARADLVALDPRFAGARLEPRSGASSAARRQRQANPVE
jgi:hypothetical protein